MEDAGVPMSDGLGIVVHLVDMLPTILIHLAFHSTMLMLTSFALEVYASRPWLRMNIMDLMHTPPLQSDQMALDVLREEIINNLGGAPKAAKVVEPMACFSVPSLSSVGGQAGEVGTGDGTAKSPCTSHTPCSLGRHSQTQSLSPRHHSQSSQSSSSSSGSGSRSGSVSGTSTSGSLSSGSYSGSHASSQACSDGSGSHVSVHSHSASLEIVLVHSNDDDTTMVGEEDAPHSDDEENLSQGTVSLPDISASDDEDARKAIACETMRIRVMSNMVTGEMNKSARGMKVLLSGTRGFMIMPMLGNLARLQTKLVLP